MINTILFDLDGTLARMDQDLFIETYFKKLGALVASHGYDPKQIIQAIWAGTGAMLKNDGSMTNEECFWKVFFNSGLPDAKGLKPLLDHFYANEFDTIREITSPNKLSRKMIASLRRKGYKIGLATSPVFPRIATELRIAWAGLVPTDIDLITTYENSHYGKPSEGYYREVLQALGSAPEECIMIGNDVDEDMCTERLGMSVYLVTEHLLNRHNTDYSSYPQGSLSDLAAYLEALPDLRFSYRRMAQYHETDQMGIIYHANYIQWFEEARVAWMDQLGYGYDAMEKAGIGSPVLEVHCNYHSPVRFHDTVLVRLRLTEFTGTRLRVSYEVSDEATGALRATGESSHCFVEHSTGMPVSLKKTHPDIYELFCKQMRK